MLETIVGWIANVVGEGFEAIVNLFFQCLTLDLNTFINIFPLLPTSYQIFQSVAMGLVVGIAIFQLMKFFGGQIVEMKDTPIRVLLRSAVAVALIWFGGYLISMIVDLARTPYDVFVNDVVSVPDITFAEGISTAVAVTFGGLSASVILVLELVMLLLIGWNILKHIIEACERFTMVGVLAYSAPLIYPTIASQATSTIFKKWLGMFFGQCILMTLTIWSLRLVLSGFAFNVGPDAQPYFIRFVMTLAMCKVAQRLDTYMQQLGIGVATTGGNLLDEAMGVAAMAMGMGRFRGFGGGGGSNSSGKSDSVLGAGGDKRTLSKVGGIFGAASNAVQKGVQSFKQGDGAGTVAKTIGKAAVDGAFGGVSRVRDGLDGLANARKDSQAKKTADDAKRDAEAFKKRGEKYRDPNKSDPSYSNDIQKKAAAAGKTAQQYTQAQYDKKGAGGVGTTGNGKTALNQRAREAGLKWNNGKTDGHANPIIGSDKSVGEHMAANYSEAVSRPDYQDAMVETAARGSAVAAEAALMNPYHELSGNDQVGAALMDNAFSDGFNEAYGQPDKKGKYHDMAEFSSALSATAAGETASGGEGVSNISATTNAETKGRTVTADYKTASGEQYKVDIMDNFAYWRGTTEAERKDMKEVKSKDGSTYYTKVSKVELVDTASSGTTPHQTPASDYSTPVTSSRSRPQTSTADTHSSAPPPESGGRRSARSSSAPRKDGNQGILGGR